MSEETPNWSADAPAAPPKTAAKSPPKSAAEAPEAGAPAVASMSFEQALVELERIVQDLERGQLDLEVAIQAYERGTALKTHCETKLREAQLRVETISLGGNGAVTAEPAELG